MLKVIVSSKDENLIHAMHYLIFQAMVRIASIAVLAMVSDYMEDDEDEVEAVHELGQTFCSKIRSSTALNIYF